MKPYVIRHYSRRTTNRTIRWITNWTIRRITNWTTRRCSNPDRRKGKKMHASWWTTTRSSTIRPDLRVNSNPRINPTRLNPNSRFNSDCPRKTIDRLSTNITIRHSDLVIRIINIIIRLDLIIWITIWITVRNWITTRRNLNWINWTNWIIRRTNRIIRRINWIIRRINARRINWTIRRINWTIRWSKWSIRRRWIKSRTKITTPIKWIMEFRGW